MPILNISFTNRSCVFQAIVDKKSPHVIKGKGARIAIEKNAKENEDIRRR